MGTGGTAWRSRAPHRREAVRYETVFGVGFRDRRSRTEVGRPSVNVVMTAAYWLIGAAHAQLEQEEPELGGLRLSGEAARAE